MAFVIALFLLLLLCLYSASSSADKRNAMSTFYKTHPPCKLQEEYLLACEYYHKYIFDGERPQEACENALRSARIDLFNAGYLPSCYQLSGTSLFEANDPIMKQETHPINNNLLSACDPPSGVDIVDSSTLVYHGLMSIREDETNFTCCASDIRRLEYKNDKKWAEYCKQLDEKFDSLVIQSLVDYGVVDGNTHDGSAYILERNNIGTLMNPTWSEYKKLEFATKWIDPDKLKDVPYKQREIIHYNGKEYEKILELHRDEIPSYLEKRRIMQPLKPKQEPETPYGR